MTAAAHRGRFRGRHQGRRQGGQKPPASKRTGLWLAVALSIALIAIYVAGRLVWNTGSGSELSLAFGWAAVVLLFAVSALGVRKRALSLASRLRAGRSSLWLSVHLYGGSIFLLLVFLHSDLGLPHGWATAWLWGLSLWTVAGGLVGRGLQLWIPRLITSGLSNEVLYERIPDLVADLAKRASDLSAASGPEIRDLYVRTIASELEAPRRNWHYFFDITGGIRERLRPVRYLRDKLSNEEAGRLDQLESLYRAKLEIDAHFTLQQALRSWLWLHLPTSLLLWVFLGLHLWGVVRY